MTEAQRNHAETLANRFRTNMVKKYAAGAAEHPGNLFDIETLSLVRMALEEVMDLANYLQTLEAKLEAQQSEKKPLPVTHEIWVGDYQKVKEAQAKQ